MRADGLKHWFGSVGIALGGELSGTTEVRAATVILMRGTRVRVETLSYGVHEIVVRAMLFIRRELEECKEGVTWRARQCGERGLEKVAKQVRM